MTGTRKQSTTLAVVVISLALISGAGVATGSMSAASPDDDPPAPPVTEDVAATEVTEASEDAENVPSTEAPETTEAADDAEEPDADHETGAETTAPDELIVVVDIGPSSDDVPDLTDAVETTDIATTPTAPSGELQVMAATSSLGRSSTNTGIGKVSVPYGQAASVGANVHDESFSCNVFLDCDYPEGSVDFYVDDVFVGSRTLRPWCCDEISDTDDLEVFRDAGNHSLRAVYVPGNFDASSGTASFTVTKTDCTASLSGPARSTVGDNVIFNGPVTSNSEAGTASGGTLTVRRGSQGFVVRTIENYRGRLVGLNNLPVGFHTLWISYVDANHNECRSNFFGHTVHERMVCTADRYTVNQGEYFEFDPTLNDTTEEGAEILIGGWPENGDAGRTLDGQRLFYEAHFDFTGTDSLTYAITNGAGQSDSCTVTFDVGSPPVVANDDVEVAYQDNPFGLGVLYNDENAESIVDVGTPSNGTAEVVWDEPNDSEIVKYTPNPGFVGQDTFTYTASNGAGHTDEATVTVDVLPFKADDDATTTEGEAVELAVFDNDTGYDEYTSIRVDAPAHGHIDLHRCTTLSSDRCVTYAPEAGFVGTDSFSYELSKPSFGDIHATTSATVTVTVTAAASSSTTTTTTTIAPQAGNGPVAVDDWFEATADGVLMVGAPGVLANDIHPVGSPLTARLAVDAEHGTVVLNADGSFVYTPDAGFSGTDSFSYVASDGGPFVFAPAGESRGIAPGAVSAPATVVITVTPPTPTTTTAITSSTTTTTPTTPAGTLPATK